MAGSLNDLLYSILVRLEWTKSLTFKSDNGGVVGELDGDTV